MTGGMSFRTCYTKLNFEFPYVRSLLLRRDTYVLCNVKMMDIALKAVCNCGNASLYIFEHKINSIIVNNLIISYYEIN